MRAHPASMSGWLVAGLLVLLAAGGTAADDAAPPAARPASAWAQDLASKDLAVRRKAAYGLALLGAQAAPAAEALARALRDDDDYVRETAGRALTKLAADSQGVALRPALTALLEGLVDARLPVRKEAVSLLFQAGTPPPPLDAPLVEPLRKALKDEDPFVRANAAAALGQLVPAAQAARPDLAAALGDAAEDVRTWAVMALASLGAEPYQDALAGRLKDPGAKVRAAAALALGTLGAQGLSWADALAALKADGDKDVRAAALGALGGLGEARLLPLLLAGLDDSEPAVRLAAASAVMGFGPAARSTVPALLARPKDADSGVRATLLSTLAALGDPAAVPALRAGLHDAEGSVRSVAAYALGQIGPEGLDALPDLLEALIDMEPAVRMGAANAIGAQGPRARKALPALVRALEDPDPFALGSICFALGAVAAGDLATARSAVVDLLRLLSAAGSGARGYAAQALARLAPADGLDVPALVRAWNADPGAELRGPLTYLFGVLGPAAKEAAPLLRTALGASPLDPPALFALARIAASPDDVADVLARLVRAVQAGGAEATMAELTLGRLGAAAGPARAALSARVAGRPEPDLWAALALLRIGGEGSEAALRHVRQALSGAKPGLLLRQMDELDEAAPALLVLAPDVLAALLGGPDDARSPAAHALAAWARALGTEAVRLALPLLSESRPRLDSLRHDADPWRRLAAADLLDALAAH